MIRFAKIIKSIRFLLLLNDFVKFLIGKRFIGKIRKTREDAEYRCVFSRREI